MAFRRYVVNRKVIVNLLSGNAIEGVLVRRSGPLLFLRNATLHDMSADHPTEVDGEVVIERTNVDFIQAL